ncbi:Uncharacterised protein [Mycobacteroides abscessus subsp. abscessus]|nr:Uncharacterised protein [Mycobacteroides abscessus subsp. abscessus]
MDSYVGLRITGQIAAGGFRGVFQQTADQRFGCGHGCGRAGEAVSARDDEDGPEHRSGYVPHQHSEPHLTARDWPAHRPEYP